MKAAGSACWHRQQTIIVCTKICRHYADTMRDSIGSLDCYGYTAGVVQCSAVHGGAAHDDALVPNIDDIPGEQGYVQMGHMHTLCTVLVERWARDGPENSEWGHMV